MITMTSAVGDHLREWRRRRRMSQMDLALEAEISTRHLSFLETGRATPSRDMALQLAQCLDMPLREQNLFLMAAGYAPVFPARPLDDPQMRVARDAMELIIESFAPFPALAVDRGWNLVFANAAAQSLLTARDERLLAPPVNVLRLSLHPDGASGRILNLAEWRAHILDRLQGQIAASGDADLMRLHDELAAYPAPAGSPRHPAPAGGEVAVPLRLQGPDGVLSFLSTTTVFGTPVDVTLSELAIEAFLPADEETAAFLRLRAAG